MKTSTVVASLLFGSIAAAAPLNKRVLVTKTNVVTETVVVVTTVWDGEAATSTEVKPTSSAGLFFEKGPDNSKPSSSSVYVPPVNTPPAVTSTPEAPKPAPTPSSTSTSSSSTYSPPPPPASTPAKQEQQQPSSTQPAATSSAAAPSQASSSGGGSGETHTGGSITMNYFSGGTGSCGEAIQDTDMAVALASDLFGPSTYDPATGNPTNKWCNQKVAITYNGVTQNAVIKDRCDGCTNGGFDMTPALWKAITGGVGGGNGDRLYGATWQAVA